MYSVQKHFSLDAANFFLFGQEEEVTSPLISTPAWTLRLKFSKYQQSYAPMKIFNFLGVIPLTVYIWSTELYRSQFMFHALTFARFRGRCWKPRPSGSVFNTSQETWQMLMHWKTLFDCYYCIKTENIYYILRYFVHYFVTPFHRCLLNLISTDYACSRAEQYTSRNGCKSVAPVRSYWKLHNCALTVRELPC